MNNGQPELTDEFGARFNGNAETATGNVWYYTTSDGGRRALVPANPATDAPPPTRIKFGPIVVILRPGSDDVFMQDTRTGESGNFKQHELDMAVEDFFKKHF